MEELALCGYRCDLCAARSDDPEVRQKLVNGWKKYFGHTSYTVENVKCDGCLHKGQLADKTCTVRPCAKEKNIENCAHCDDFACDKLKKLWCSESELRERFPDIPEEDFELCMRQFISKERLFGIYRALKKS